MTELTNNMTATGVVATINGNLQECGSNESISLSDGASDVCSTLNGVFGEYDGVDELSASMSATEFVAAVNKNFGIAAEGELEPLDTFSFLHMSDTHGTWQNIERCVTEMDNDSDIQFALHTGDLPGGWSGVEVQPFDNNVGKKFLFVEGNHDAKELDWALHHALDNNNTDGKYGKYLLREKAESWMSALGVEWGNTTKDTITINGEQRHMSRGIYWSKDFILSDGVRKLRVIGLDLYNTDQETQAEYWKNITGHQAEWFVDQLKEESLGSNDYFMIALHESPIALTRADTVKLRRKNAFCSSRLFTMDNSSDIAAWLSSIVDAYQTSQSKTISGTNLPSVTVAFSGKKPATFVGWFCGHLHGEMLTHNPSYPKQLVSLIDCGKASMDDSSSDLRYNNNTINAVPDDSCVSRPTTTVLINKVTINFDAKRLTLERIGLAKAAQHIVGSGYNTGEIDANETHQAGYNYDAVGNRIDGATYDNDGYLIRDTITVPFVDGRNP